MQALEFARSMMDSVILRTGASEPVSFLPVLAVAAITLIVVAVLRLVSMDLAEAVPGRVGPVRGM